ncbi:MAG: hypothetical protein QXJ75_00475 [Candidatus Bathyarchaeia archaeon]
MRLIERGPLCWSELADIVGRGYMHIFMSKWARFIEKKGFALPVREKGSWGRRRELYGLTQHGVVNLLRWGLLPISKVAQVEEKHNVNYTLMENFPVSHEPLKTAVDALFKFLRKTFPEVFYGILLKVNFEELEVSDYVPLLFWVEWKVSTSPSPHSSDVGREEAERFVNCLRRLEETGEEVKLLPWAKEMVNILIKMRDYFFPPKKEVGFEVRYHPVK